MIKLYLQKWRWYERNSLPWNRLRIHREFAKRGAFVRWPVQGNVLEAFRRLINLLPKLGFTSGTFDAQVLLECNHDRVIAAGKSLFKTYGPLIGVRDPVDRPHGPTDHVANHNGSSSHNDQRFPQG